MSAGIESPTSEFELVVAERCATCPICQAQTAYRYRLDAETILIACSINHARKLYLRLFAAPPPAFEPEAKRTRATREVIEPGTRYNSLIYVRCVGPKGNYSRVDLWQCDCGAEVEKPLVHVKDGRMTRCGRDCPLKVKPQKEKKVRALRKPIAPGKRFGQLTFVERVSVKEGRFRCDCGETVVKLLNNVRAGVTTRCSRFCRFGKG
jgi:hypothetical protein